MKKQAALKRLTRTFLEDLNEIEIEVSQKPHGIYKVELATRADFYFSVELDDEGITVLVSKSFGKPIVVGISEIDILDQFALLKLVANFNVSSSLNQSRFIAA